MKKPTLKIFSLLICALVCCSHIMLTTAYAIETDTDDYAPIVPCNTYVSYSSCSLKLSNNSFVAYGVVNAIASVNKCSMTLKLQKKSGNSWSTIKQWSGSKNSSSYSISQSVSASKGTYRAVAVSTVRTSNSSETVTNYSKTVFH